MNPPSVPIPDRPGGLLICRDLIFTSKVTGTARALGLLVMTAGNAALVTALLERWRPRAVFLDLAAGDLARPEAIATFKQLAPETPFIAFGSHVDTESLRAASEAGCELVLPRSRFTQELPALIARYLGGPSEGSPAADVSG